MTSSSGQDPSIEQALFTVADIHALLDRERHEEEVAELRHQQAAAAEKKHQEEAFLARTVTPDYVATLMQRVRRAAESGVNELMIGSFPSDWCTDGGIAINAPEDDWPDTLQGFAREFYEFWAQNLKPRGFRLNAKIINFPGGMPGDVGAFLSW